uniref:PSII 6.1 kDa protein n=1 Tax=Salix viminalis TaxID=40686 RepID=A0A6N2KST7_SALVM
MATITASAATSSIVRAALARKPSVGLSSSSVLGLPAMAKKEKVSCSIGGEAYHRRGKKQGNECIVNGSCGCRNHIKPGLGSCRRENVH